MYGNADKSGLLSMHVQFRYSGKKSDAVCGFLAYFCAVLRFLDPPCALSEHNQVSNGTRTVESQSVCYRTSDKKSICL